MAKKTSPYAKDVIPALTWLAEPQKSVPQTVCAVFGDDAYLRRTVLARLPQLFQSEKGEYKGEEINEKKKGERKERKGGGEEESGFEPAQFDANFTPWSRVSEELMTFALFGPSVKLVILSDADDFLTKNRDALEAYAAAPSETGILVLELKALAANTRFYKLLAENGLLIDCRHPQTYEIQKWVVDSARQKHHFTIQPAAAELLITQIGDEMGLLDQELAKLALLVENDAPVTPELVRKNSGSWRTQTVWTLIDCILDGHAQEALQYLGQLLDAGEAPIAITAQISSSLRRLAAAMRIIASDEKAGRRPSLSGALTAAGVNRYFLEKSAAQLRRLGRYRGEHLLEWLVALDFDLKGNSPLPPRLLLERFILRLTIKRG